MEDLEDILKENIQGILPHLSAVSIDGLIQFLKTKGVKRERDLRRLTIPILESHLHDLVDASDLHEEWQKAYG